MLGTLFRRWIIVGIGVAILVAMIVDHAYVTAQTRSIRARSGAGYVSTAQP